MLTFIIMIVGPTINMWTKLEGTMTGWEQCRPEGKVQGAAALSALKY